MSGYCTTSFSVCSRRRTKMSIIYPDLRLDYKVATLPDLPVVSTQSREKHTAKPVQFGTEIALLKSFSQCFRLVDYLKSFRGTIR